ncbi:MAG: hypothetical protein K2P70_16065 [Hyphomonadaceae bacterium]|nr:hypothetical protein [Hyphomonadaceae bacterium]
MAEKSLLDHKLRWARAMKAVADDNRHLEEIALQFKAKFYSSPRLDQFFLRGVTNHEGRLQFGAGIFFRTDADIGESEADGTSQAMRDFIYEKLEEFGRGKRHELDVQFDFDSFENVQKNFEGSYFLRLR